MRFQPIKLSIFGLHVTSRLCIWNFSSNEPVVTILRRDLLVGPFTEPPRSKGLKGYLVTWLLVTKTLTWFYAFFKNFFQVIFNGFISKWNTYISLCFAHFLVFFWRLENLFLNLLRLLTALWNLWLSLNPASLTCSLWKGKGLSVRIKLIVDWWFLIKHWPEFILIVKLKTSQKVSCLSKSRPECFKLDSNPEPISF